MSASGAGARVPEPAILAAIVAAVDQVWTGVAPQQVVSTDVPLHTVWRFSGRWWAKPTVARRDRPSTVR